MSTAKDLRKQARQMNKMAEMMEIVELSKSGDPQALQKFYAKKLERKLRNQAQSQLRKAINKSLGLK